MTDEITEVLRQAMHEIRVLRRVNEILNAKVEVMDLFACVLHTTAASHSQVMSVDVAWQIERLLEKAEAMSDGVNPNRSK